MTREQKWCKAKQSKAKQGKAPFTLIQPQVSCFMASLNPPAFIPGNSKCKHTKNIERKQGYIFSTPRFHSLQAFIPFSIQIPAPISYSNASRSLLSNFTYKLMSKSCKWCFPHLVVREAKVIHDPGGLLACSLVEDISMKRYCREGKNCSIQAAKECGAERRVQSNVECSQLILGCSSVCAVSMQ